MIVGDKNLSMKKDRKNRSTIETGPDTKTVSGPAENGRMDARKQAEKYYREGKIFGRRDKPFFIDVENLPKNLGEMRLLVQEHDDNFRRLPGETKQMFENSPEKMIEFLRDKRNIVKAAHLGLLTPKLKAKVLAEAKKLALKVRKANKEAEKKEKGTGDS